MKGLLRNIILLCTILCTLSPLVSAKWDAQEDPTESACTGSWGVALTCANTVDGDWSTRGAGNSEGYIYVNYSKPDNVLNTSLWQVKDEDGTVNLTIPNDCWSRAQLEFRAYSDNNADPATKTVWSCRDGPGSWSDLRTTVSQVNVYEERVWWDNATCNPPAGVGDWEVDGTEICSDESINITGNLYVRSGDKLVFDNVNFSIDLPSSSYYDLWVLAGGEFVTDNGTVLREKDEDLYYHAYIYDDATIRDTTVVGNNLNLFRVLNVADVTIENSTLYTVQLETQTSSLVMNDSTAFSVKYKVVGGSDVVIDGLDDRGTINYNITSTTTSEDMNLSNVTVTRFLVENDGGTLLLNNSDVYSVQLYDDANDNSTVQNTNMTLAYHYAQNGAMSIDGFDQPYTKDTANNLTVDWESSAGSKISYENVGVATGHFYATGGTMKITNSDVGYLYSNAAGSVLNATNTSCTYVYCYTDNTPHVYLQNVTPSTRLMLYGSCQANITDSAVELSQYTRIYDTANVNFSQPYSMIDDLDLEGAAESTTIHGYVNFTNPIDDWAVGNNLNRYFPFNVTDHHDQPLEGVNVSINDSGTIVTSGLTNSDGIVILNLSRDDNALFGVGSDPDNAAAKVYAVYVDGLYRQNISMLEGTGPYGIQIVGTSCTYGGSGAWTLYGSDACSISSSVQLDGSQLTFQDGGAITVTGELLNWSNATASGGVSVRVQSGGNVTSLET